MRCGRGGRAPTGHVSAGAVECEMGSLSRGFAGSGVRAPTIDTVLFERVGDDRVTLGYRGSAGSWRALTVRAFGELWSGLVDRWVCSESGQGFVADRVTHLGSEML